MQSTKCYAQEIEIVHAEPERGRERERLVWDVWMGEEKCCYFWNGRENYNNQPEEINEMTIYKICEWME